MHHHSPRVSLGVPVYNGAAFLPATLDALLAQTYPDFELIISDNASTDRTEAICRDYAARDARIRYERHGENRGAAWNYNRVLLLARGEFFKWAAADDLCAPTWLERCVAVLDYDPGVVWCQSQAAKIDACGRPLAEDPEDDEPQANFVHSTQAGLPRVAHDAPQPERRFRGVLLGRNWCTDVYGLIRTAVLQQTGRMPDYYGGEKVLVAELSLRGRYREIPETLFFQRIHPAASGNCNAAAAQRQFMNPRARPWTCARLQLLAGYVAAIRRAPLTWPQRANCLAAVARYLCQTRKWSKVLRNALTGAGVGNRKVSPAANGPRRFLARAPRPQP